MDNRSRGRLGASVALSLLLAACAQPPAPSSAPGPAVAGSAPDGPTLSAARRADADWRDERIYFVLTDRFANGDRRNDAPAGLAAADPGNPLGWHGGDFAGLARKIEEGYFERLGFTALWITPVTLQVPPIPVASGPNTGKTFAGYHGYWAGDFFKTDPHLGTAKELKDLVQTAHRHGLKVIQDIVVNHAGYGSPLVAQHPEWFHTDADCAAAANKDQDCALAGLPDFKQDRADVKQYLDDFVRFWTQETKVDGLRLDTMKHVPDAYWSSFFARGGPGDPKRVWSVGEVFNGDPAVLAKYMDVLGSPSVFDFALYFAVKDHLSSPGGNLDRVADVFARDGAYNDPSRLSTFVDNHDVPRFMSEAANRGVTGDAARERLDAALSLIFLSRGTPTVYAGTEIAMLGKGDPYDSPPGESNREDMRFGEVAGSPLAARLTALNAARDGLRALTHGAQQELWRPNGGAPLFAFRRVLSGAEPVVALLNGGDAPLDLAALPGGGLPLLGTLADGAVREVTRRPHSLRVVGGKLVGVVPPRTMLAVTGTAGTGGGTAQNPALGNVANLAAVPGDAAAKLTWTPATDPNVVGYRVYQRRAGAADFTLLNFAPLPKETTSFLARGLVDGQAYAFKVVSVDAGGAESPGVSANATPSADLTVKVTLSVDARTQGNGRVEVRRFDTGAQLEFPMTQTETGRWKTTLDLPRFREIKFKFGNDAPNARNSGYEGPGQPDRTFVADAGADLTAVYDFITLPVPAATVTGRVTGGGANLGNATVTAQSNPDLHYALTFPDGTYVLRAPSGAQTLGATAPGFEDAAARPVTAPATNVDFALAATAGTPNLTTPGLGGFGASNNFSRVTVSGSAAALDLQVLYTVGGGNAMIVYLDLGDGGATDARTFSAWAKNATFAEGVQFFVARYESQDPQLWRVEANGAATQITSGVTFQTGTGSLRATIPWSALGFAARPAGPLKLYGGIFGGGDYGAGDIFPSAVSTPAAPQNTVDQANNFKVTFGAPLSVPLN